VYAKQEKSFLRHSEAYHTGGQLFDEFLQIIKSFVDAELEFYRIDKSTNFDLSTIEGQYNHQLAGLYFGTAEVSSTFLPSVSLSNIFKGFH